MNSSSFALIAVFVGGVILGAMIMYWFISIRDIEDASFFPINYEDKSGRQLSCDCNTGIVYCGGETESYSAYRSDNGYLYIYHDGIMQEMRCVPNITV